MILVRFMGAAVRQMDDGEREYTEREPIYINPERVDVVYDHTVIVGGNKVRVMDDAETIAEKLTSTDMWNGYITDGNADSGGPVAFR